MEDCRENLVQGLGAASLASTTRRRLRLGRRAWLRLGAAFLATRSRLPLHVQGRVVPRRLGRGELGGGTLDVYLSYTFINNMYVMKCIQFLNHIGWILASGMIKPRIAGHHLEGNPSKPPGHLHMDAAGIRALSGPFRRQHPEVVIAPNQGVGGQEQGLAESAVAAADQRPEARSTSSL